MQCQWRAARSRGTVEPVCIYPKGEYCAVYIYISRVNLRQTLEARNFS